MKTIAIIDNSSKGHRLYHMQQFVNSLYELDYKVVCIIPEVHLVKSWIESKHTEANKNIIYVEFNAKEVKYKKGLINYVDDLWYAVRCWLEYKRVLKKIEKEHHIKIDFFFLNNVDTFLSCFFHPILHRLFFKYKWSGFYVHTRYMRMYKDIEKRKTKLSDIDYLFTSKNCLGVTVADEGVAAGMQYRIDKKVVGLPDITETNLPDEKPALAVEIKEKANNRTIVGLIGMETFKGSIEMAKLALKADADDFYFVFCGYYDETFLNYCNDEADKQFFVSFQQNLPKNVLWNCNYLKDEQEYNAIFNTFDVVYMVYREHFTSSNRLTKAAVFNKLVLASNNYFVGENVVKYNLGETAASENLDEQLEKLEKLRNKIINHDFPTEQWKIYAEKNSEKQLTEKLAEIINL
ncbi:MAG: hypothetical protein U0U67_06515 [Chitinophagales bacterium]